MERLLIVDGNNLLFQMFYGFPAKVFSRSGRPIQGTIGFVSTLLKLKRTYNITRIAVVFDQDGSDERKDLLTEYKANRPDNWDELPPEECPFTEEETIVKCLRFLGIEPFYSVGMEADDVIATLALRYGKDQEVVISSFDSDFFQLIGPHVSVLRYRGKASVLYDEKQFSEVFGFSPKSYVFYKSLVGDTADNIPGVPGIGKVWGSRICRSLEEGETLESMTLPPRLRQSLEEHKETIDRNRTLIALRERMELEVGEEAFAFSEEHFALTNTQVLEACEVFSS